DLRAAIRQARRVVGPPPIAVAVAILCELLDALDYAHNRRDQAGQPLGLVHRDISPSNLLIDVAGHLKVIDFGVAKATQGQLQTKTGGIKGKLSYMPPEMLAGRPLDGRSDLFSASVIAHELLTTAPLFTGQSEFQTMDRVQRMEPPPPSARNRDCPPELDAIVLKGLAKEPDLRWSSAAEMRRELADLAVRERLLATSRDVAGWMEWAFGPGAARRPLPLAAPETGGETGSEASESASESAPAALNDREFEAAWEWLRSRVAPILVDDVPDVSDRLVVQPTGPAAPPAAPIPDEDAPTVAVELLPDEDVFPLLDAPSGAAGLATEVQSTDPETTPHQRVPIDPAWLNPRRVGEPTPTEWADGTEPESKLPVADRFALRAQPAWPPPAPAWPPTAPPPAAFPSPTLRDRLSAVLQRWRWRWHTRRSRQDTGEVRLRPSATRAVIVCVVAGIAITAAAAWILGRDRPRVDRTGRAAPSPAASRPMEPRASASGETSPGSAEDDAPHLVPPDRVKLRRGEPPILRLAETGPTPPVLDAELCVDRKGSVASVKILTPVSIAARSALTRDLGRWRYRPIERDGHRVPGCFSTQVRPTFTD
ncbi:MAG TPA: serine/threonine-protein kinase, partial [Kofleriaceae bacterium]